MVLPADPHPHRRRVTRLLARRRPKRLAGVYVKGHDAGISLRAPDVHDHAPADDERRGARAKIALIRAEIPMRIAAPEPLPRSGIDAGKHALGAEDDDASLVDKRRAEGPVAAPHLRRKRGRMRIAPERPPCGRIERLECLTVVNAMEQIHAAARNGHAGNTRTHRSPPDVPRSRGGPGVGEPFVGRRDTVPGGPKNLWPVASPDNRHRREHNRGGEACNAHQSIRFRWR